MCKTFENLSDARIEAKIQARNADSSLFVVRTFEGRYVITERQPILCEYWQAYPDGLFVRRG